jgi:hypothetical protein
VEHNIIFFGIHFRSASHLLWFEISMVLFGISILESFFCLLSKKDELAEKVYGMQKSIARFHGATALIAVFVTKFGTVNGDAYSVDCIWFNSLMVAIYLMFVFSVRKIRAKVYAQWKI